MDVFLLIIAIICALDIVTFIVQAFGNASDFVYYLCRPFWGLISGSGIGMAIGFVIRVAEVVFASIEIFHFCIG